MPRPSVPALAAITAACLTIGAGCYSPSYKDCEVSCATGACPADLSCVSGVCRAPGMTGMCGGGSGVDSGGGGDGGLPLSALAAEELRLICDAQVRCGMFEDVATCRMAYDGRLGLPQNVVAAVNAGKVIYHEDLARQCLDPIATQSCSRTGFPFGRDQPAACYAVFAGTVGDMGACEFDQECISQSCNVSSCTMACCPGTCVGSAPPMLLHVGDACMNNKSRCVGSYCGANLTCQPYLTNGTGCTSNDQCASDSICTGSPQICRALSPPGGLCMQTSDCRDMNNVCSSQVCRPGGLSGATCPSPTECLAFHTCDGQGKCALLPALGQACTDTTGCLSGNCDPTNHVCTPPAADGAACLPNGSFQCASDYCEPMSLTCQPQPICI